MKRSGIFCSRWRRDSEILRIDDSGTHAVACETVSKSKLEDIIEACSGNSRALSAIVELGELLVAERKRRRVPRSASFGHDE